MEFARKTAPRKTVVKKMPLGQCVDNRANVAHQNSNGVPTKPSAAELVLDLKALAKPTHTQTAPLAAPLAQQGGSNNANNTNTLHRKGSFQSTACHTHRSNATNCTTGRKKAYPSYNRPVLMLPQMLQDIEIPPQGTEEHAGVMHKISQREKQLSLGRCTSGYINYRKAVPLRDPANKDHINTPRATWSVSKRQFDLHIRQWRRDLHYWDNEAEEETEAEYSVADVSLDVSSDCITDEQHTPNQSINQSIVVEDVFGQMPDLVPMEDSDLAQDLQVLPSAQDLSVLSSSRSLQVLPSQDMQVLPQLSLSTCDYALDEVVRVVDVDHVDEAEVCGGGGREYSF